MSSSHARMGYARFGRRWARNVVEIADDVACLQTGGFWAVVVTFEGVVRCVRFAQVDEAPGADEQPRQVAGWAPLTGDWSSSLDERAYLAGVSQIRDRIAAGDVYQVSLCRV
ncbi:MAG: anthranilate synthase component I family protein, partial [Dermatophilaceae bacterium]